MTCRSGCATQDHRSYAECLRDSVIRVAYTNSANGWDYTKQKKWESELGAYKQARQEGIQPTGTTRREIDRAKRLSDAAQRPYDGRHL
jgi:hypothetical protein